MKAFDFHRMLNSMAETWTERTYGKVVEVFDEELFYSDGRNYTITSKTELLKFFENDDGCSQFCKFHNFLFDEQKPNGGW